MGLRYYASGTPGIGGRLKTKETDFVVVERPGLSVQPLDAESGPYPYLVVEATATGRDTHAVLAEIADAMRIHPGRIAISGTKDANAVTTQWLTIRSVDPPQLPTIDGVQFTPVGRLGRQLEFGDHVGNEFEIIVREATHPDRVDTITADLGGDRVTVPNFFGHQRFGARRSITHVVGRHLVRGDTRAAVETYLTASSPYEPDRTQTARAAIADALADGDADGALATTPGYLTYERQLLSSLVEHGADAYDDALESLPWSLTRLFVHAVQSLAFNELLSERLRRGWSLTTPLVGDTIAFVDDDGRIDTDRVQVVTDRRHRVATRHCERERAAVVGPLVGPETPRFDGEVGRVYRTVLDGLGIEREMFINANGAAGTWRPLAVITDLEVSADPVTFTFELPPGSYATVVLREYCKVDPSKMV